MPFQVIPTVKSDQLQTHCHSCICQEKGYYIHTTECLQYLSMTLSHVNKKSQRMTNYIVGENLQIEISTDAR